MFLRRAIISAPALCLALSSSAFAACSVGAGNARCVTTDSSASGRLSGAFAHSEQRKTRSARFVSAPRRVVPEYRAGYLRDPAVPAATYIAGDTLPDDVSILFNRERYGLPAPRDGWTYYRVGSEVFRADIRTRKVIDRVNDHMEIRF